MTTTFKQFFQELKESTLCDTDVLKSIKLTPEQFFWLASQCLKSGQNLNVFLYLLKMYPINSKNMQFYEKLLIQNVNICAKVPTLDVKNNKYKCLSLLIKSSEKYINSFKGGKLFDYLYFENIIDETILELFKDCGQNFLQIKNEYCLCYLAHSNKSIEGLTDWLNMVGLPLNEQSLFFERFIKYIFFKELKVNNIELINFIELLNDYLLINADEILNVIIDNFHEEKINHTLFVYCIELLLQNKEIKDSNLGYKVLSSNNPLLWAHLGRYDLNWSKEDIAGNTGFDLFAEDKLINQIAQVNPLLLKMLEKLPELPLGQDLMQSYSMITQSVKAYVKSQLAYNKEVDPCHPLAETYLDIEQDESVLQKVINQNDKEHIIFLFSEFCEKNSFRIDQDKIDKDTTYSDIVIRIDRELNKSIRQMYLPLSSPLITSFVEWSEGHYLLDDYNPPPVLECKELKLLTPFYTPEDTSNETIGINHWEEGKLLLEKYKIDTQDVSYNTFRQLYINNTVEKNDKEKIRKLFISHSQSLDLESIAKTEIPEVPVVSTAPVEETIPEVIDEAFISQELFSQKDKDEFIAENKAEEERKEVKKLVLQLSGKGVFNKKLLAKSTNLFTQIENLYHNFPHFEKVIQHLENHCHLQKAGNGVFYIPPLLFAGGPGVGKTFFAHQLSMLVKTNFHMFNMESMTAGWILMGLNGSWSGSATGKVFDVLMKKEMMNPIFLLDEIDKCPKGSYSAENALLSLLEQYTAKNFRDECVPLPIDASNIIWFATANNLQSISAPIKSRFDIFNIPSPNSEQKKALISNIYRSVLSSNSWGVKFSGNLPSATLDILSQTMTPGAARDLRKIITTGCAKAIRANRDELRIEDLESFEQPIPKPWDMMAIEA